MIRREQLRFQFEYGERDWICLFDINAHNNQCYSEIEHAFLSSAAEVKQCAIIIPPQRYIPIKKNEKYTDRRSNYVTTSKKIINEL